MNLSLILGSLGVSADEVSEQYGIFGPLSKKSNWERAKDKFQVKSFMVICFDNALNGNFKDYMSGIYFLVERVELYLKNPELAEFSVWISILDEYQDFISYAVSVFDEEFKSEKENKDIIAVLFWVISNINSIRNRGN